jgi:hypothetical protein
VEATNRLNKGKAIKERNKIESEKEEGKDFKKGANIDNLNI